MRRVLTTSIGVVAAAAMLPPIAPHSPPWMELTGSPLRSDHTCLRRS
eukprot:CAMPEP_0205832572 /NCGR_PEP_ID=MMETSP0206-20130828/47285_1 /ASSEMBLY_ACC=CAM_ASM_000279 /TAXON_ID=36767 /ORGANISM="Euplotes focardii, Strain TN1" /LENGTH=46 /DNA_ID= /DNA_START= /DNA_END= /DNA_ORIENTATION=